MYSRGCFKPKITDPSVASHFKWISSIVHKSNILFLALVYTPGESAWKALVGFFSQKVVKPNKANKEFFHQTLGFQNILQNESN